jgi:hypothetical protein
MLLRENNDDILLSRLKLQNFKKKNLTLSGNIQKWQTKSYGIGNRVFYKKMKN